MADLAARIRVEHEATHALMQQSLERAINTGMLLLEAKARLGHGQWLPWLNEHCGIPQRSAQMYMSLARNADEIRSVADLTVNEAVRLIAKSSLNIRTLIERKSFTLETPQAMLPSPIGRKIRVARNQAERKWMLAIGPDVSRETVKQRERAARETKGVIRLQQERDQLLESATELEAEAKAIRERAETIRVEIADQVTALVGPANPYTETFTYQSVNEATESELTAMEQKQLVARLLAARNGSDDGLIGIDHGFWGDLTLMHAQPITEPTGWRGTGWTKMGSPEWLRELFPDFINDAATTPTAAPSEAATVPRAMPR